MTEYRLAPRRETIPKAMRSRLMIMTDHGEFDAPQSLIDLWARAPKRKRDGRPKASTKLGRLAYAEEKRVLKAVRKYWRDHA